MAQPLNGGIPPGLDLDANFTLRFTALDPATGDVDPSVLISNASLLVDNLGGGDLTTGFQVDEIEWLHLEDNPFAPEEA